MYVYIWMDAYIGVCVCGVCIANNNISAQLLRINPN